MTGRMWWSLAAEFGMDPAEVNRLLEEEAEFYGELPERGHRRRDRKS